jgi:hypothetical protein
VLLLLALLHLALLLLVLLLLVLPHLVLLPLVLLPQSILTPGLIPEVTPVHPKLFLLERYSPEALNPSRLQPYLHKQLQLQ